MKSVGQNTHHSEVVVGEDRQREGGDADDQRDRQGQGIGDAEPEKKREGDEGKRDGVVEPGMDGLGDEAHGA